MAKILRSNSAAMDAISEGGGVGNGSLNWIRLTGLALEVAGQNIICNRIPQILLTNVLHISIYGWFGISIINITN